MRRRLTRREPQLLPAQAQPSRHRVAVTIANPRRSCRRLSLALTLTLTLALTLTLTVALALTLTLALTANQGAAADATVLGGSGSAPQDTERVATALSYLDANTEQELQHPPSFVIAAPPPLAAEEAVSALSLPSYHPATPRSGGGGERPIVT